MKILILGGTAFYGRYLTQNLQLAGHNITLYTRGNNQILENEFSKHGIKFIHGDRTNYTEFNRTFSSIADNYDVIIDNTAMNSDDVSSIVETFKGRTSHYILCSSVAVYPDWNRQTPYNEEESNLDFISTTPENYTETKKWIASYANNRREAEKTLIENGKTLPYTIIRPSVIEGPHDHTKRLWYWIEKLLHGTPVLIPGNPKPPIIQHVFVEDVANFVSAVIKKAPQNKAYNVVGDDLINLDNYLKMIYSYISLKDSRIKPLSLMQINQDQVNVNLADFPAFYDYSLCVSNHAAKTDFEFNPTKITNWLPIMVDWHIKNYN